MQRSRLLHFSRHHRTLSPPAERLLWSHLRNRRLQNFKFRRQRPIGPYIVDFICLSAKLIIEVDGGQHVQQTAHDARRTSWLNAPLVFGDARVRLTTVLLVRTIFAIVTP